MKIKTTLFSLMLLSFPGLAFAQCSGSMKHETAMSCAEGYQMDSETATCVPIVTG